MGDNYDDLKPAAELTPIKIGILVREETSMKCTGKGCLKSFLREPSPSAFMGIIRWNLSAFFIAAGISNISLRG